MTLLHDFFFTDDANLPPHVIANSIFCISLSYAQIFDLQTWQNLLSVEYQVIARWEDGAVWQILYLAWFSLRKDDPSHIQGHTSPHLFQQENYWRSF
jgi:hypothetical protein